MDWIKILAEWLKPEPNLSDDDKEMMVWAEAVKSSNWVKLHQMARDRNMEPHDFFDQIALGYCYCYAAGVEPTRDADWTAFKKTLENLHYPAMAEAITIRADGKLRKP